MVNRTIPHVNIIPILQDNYVFAICQGDEALVIDPGEAEPVIEFLQKEGLNLKAVLVTHHHPDHIGGLAFLRSQYGMPIYAPLANREQISTADNYVENQQIIRILGLDIQVYELPGHTLGHVAYWFEKQQWLFSGDVLFGLGCGRLFEGTYEQAFDSLSKIKSFPDETLVYCTHEYTAANLRFCGHLSGPLKSLVATVSLEKYAANLKILRENSLPSVPLNLAIEKSVNPFLIANNLEEFTQLRQLRNTFR